MEKSVSTRLNPNGHIKNFFGIEIWAAATICWLYGKSDIINYQI